MGLYKSKLGYGVALVDLIALSPTYTKFDPTSPEIEYEFVTAISGIDVPQGLPFTVLSFPAMSYADFAALNTWFGVSKTTRTAANTVYVLSTGQNFARYNGLIHFPTFEKAQGAYKNVEYRITRLVAL